MRNPSAILVPELLLALVCSGCVLEQAESDETADPHHQASPGDLEALAEAWVSSEDGGSATSVSADEWSEAAPMEEELARPSRGEPAPGGEPCSSSDDCPPGHACWGPAGCDATWTCVPGPCTNDLVAYCGCDGETFRASGTCPGRSYVARGPCDG